MAAEDLKPIPVPLLGLNDDPPFSEQLPRTTRKARNMRSVDPITNRTRLAQRAGTEKFVTAAVKSGNPVKAIGATIFDNPNAVYLRPADADIVTETFTAKAARPVKVMAGDGLGNFFANDGFAGVVKYNSEVTEVLRVAVPLLNSDHEILRLIANAQGELYASDYFREDFSTDTAFTSSTDKAGDETQAGIWKYVSISSTEMSLLWEIRPEGFVADMVLKDGLLYTVQNKPSLQRADVIVYGNLNGELGSLDPTVSFRRDNVSYPANGLDVGANGAIYVISERFTDRGNNPKAPSSTGVRDDGYKIQDLPNWQSRVWSWYDAQTLRDDDPTLVEDDPITFVRDLSGHQRHLYQGTEEAPTYNEEALSGLPGMHWTEGLQQWLTSKANPGTSEGQADQQKSILPGFADDSNVGLGQFCLFILLRPKRATAAEVTAGTINPVIGYRRAGVAGAAQDFMLACNREDDAVGSGASGTLGGSAVAGAISLYMRSKVGDPPTLGTVPTTADDACPPDGTFDNDSDAVLVTWLNNSEIQDTPNGPSDNTSRGLLRINGEPLDRWGSPPMLNDLAQELGHFLANPSEGYFAGDILELVCLRSQADDSGNDNILEHPQYPEEAFHAPTPSGTATTEMERIEGRIMKRWGVSHLLDDGGVSGYAHPYRNLCPILEDQGNGSDTVPPIGRAGDVVEAGEGTVPGDVNLLEATGSILAKYDGANGNLVWAFTNNPTVGAASGYACAVNSEGNIYTYGPQGDGSTAGPGLRMIVDLGDDFSTDTLDGHWAGISSIRPIFKRPKLCVDKFDNVYVPVVEISTSDRSALWVYDKTGTLLVQYETNDGGTVDEQVGAYACAIDPGIPPYSLANVVVSPDDFSAGGILTAPWQSVASGNISVDANATAGPFDGTFADRINDIKNNAEAVLYQVFDDLVSGRNYAATIYLKADTTEDVEFGILSTLANVDVSGAIDFSGSTPVVTLQSAGGGAAVSPGIKSASVSEFATNGFYRFTLLFEASSDAEHEFRLSPSTGDPTDMLAVFAYGAMLEEGTCPTAFLNFSTGIAQHVFLGLHTNSYAGTTDPLTGANIAKLELVQSANDNGQPRTLKVLAVAGDDVKRIDGDLDEVIEIQGGDGGDGLVDSNALAVCVFQYFDKLMVVDGQSVFEYDPSDESITKLKATKGGGVPQGYKFGVEYRGRLFLGRGNDNPSAWACSAIGDAGDWQFILPVELSTQAVDGTTSLIGEPGDAINTLITYNDDFLIAGCDHSIYRLSGDPMDGGQWHPMSHTIGMAYGKPWTKDEFGNIYFFGSLGGIYMIPAGTLSIIRLTEVTIEKRLRDIDLTKRYVRLEYDTCLEGIWIIQGPYHETGVAVETWFWDKRTARMHAPDAKRAGWWEDDWETTGIQPSALYVLNGDKPNDRVTLMGCEDGIVRKVVSTAKSDDGNAIRSSVLIGPLASPDLPLESRALYPQVTLANDQDGAEVRLYSENEPEELTAPTGVAKLHPGRNKRDRVKARGSYTYLELANGAADERFAVESIMVEGYLAGGHKKRGAK